METPQNNPHQIQQNIIIVGKQKSVGVAFLLAFLFGPLGLFYASILGGFVMLIFPFVFTYLVTSSSSGAGVLLGLGSFFIWVIVDWVICIIWAVIAANAANSNAVKNASKNFSSISNINTSKKNEETYSTPNPTSAIKTNEPEPVEETKEEITKEIPKEKRVSISTKAIAIVVSNKKTVFYTIVVIALCFLSLYLFKKFKPIDYSNPETVLKAYREFSVSNSDLGKIYDDLLSDESRKLLDRDEFIKIKETKYADEKIERTYTKLALDNNNSTFRRLTVKETIFLKDKLAHHLYYYTLKNENGKWKIIWAYKLLLFGDDQYIKGDYSGAIRTYEKIIAINPYDASAYRRIADCYSRLEKNDECLKYCKLAITLEPENMDVYNSIAGYYGKVGNSKMDIEYLNRGLEYCLNDWDKSNFYSNIAGCYLTLKDFPNAESNAQLAINSDSTQTYAWFIFGKIKHTDNKWQVAKEYYAKAITLHKLEPLFQFELYANYASCCISDNECDSAKKYSMKALDLFPESKPMQEINEKAQNCN